MRKRAFLMLGLALILAVATVFLARSWLERQVRPIIVQEQEKAPVSTIVVARSDLEFGNRIGAEHLREVEWLAESLPEGAFTKIEQLVPEDTDDERVVLRRIQRNEPVLASKISGPGGRATLSAIIEPEMRALTIRVNDVLGVAGFVLPGDRVDILLTREESKERPITDVLLQNVKVLGIDQEASEDKDKPVVVRAVTLEVTTTQAQKLTLAATVGVLSLALRNRTNVTASVARTITVGDLRVGEAIDTSEPGEKPAAKRVVQTTDTRASVTVTRALAPASYKVTKDRGRRGSGKPLTRSAPLGGIGIDAPRPTILLPYQSSSNLGNPTTNQAYRPSAAGTGPITATPVN